MPSGIGPERLHQRRGLAPGHGLGLALPGAAHEGFDFMPRAARVDIAGLAGVQGAQRPWIGQRGKCLVEHDVPSRRTCSPVQPPYTLAQPPASYLTQGADSYKSIDYVSFLMFFLELSACAAARSARSRPIFSPSLISIPRSTGW